MTLMACIWQNPTTKGDKMMADEETVAANEAILLKHFEEIGLDDSVRSRDYFAKSGAYLLGREATKNHIVDVSSVVHENGDIDVTVIDEAGNTFVLYYGKHGNLGVIKDGDGEFVFMKIE